MPVPDADGDLVEAAEEWIDKDSLMPDEGLVVTPGSGPLDNANWGEVAGCAAAGTEVVIGAIVTAPGEGLLGS